MTRLAVTFATLGALLLAGGCSLDFNECGSNDLTCGGDDSMCVCSTGKCAEPDEDCASGLHYVGGRCVSLSDSASAIRSTPEIHGVCAGSDGGRDTADARDLGGIP
jgi:hypothetical protein